MIRLIAEIDLAQLDIAFQLDVYGIGLLDHIRPGINNLKNTLCRIHALCPPLEYVRKKFHRALQQGEIPCKGQ